MSGRGGRSLPRTRARYRPSSCSRLNADARGGADPVLRRSSRQAGDAYLSAFRQHPAPSTASTRAGRPAVDRCQVSECSPARAPHRGGLRPPRLRETRIGAHQRGGAVDGEITTAGQGRGHARQAGGTRARDVLEAHRETVYGCERQGRAWAGTRTVREGPPQGEGEVVARVARLAGPRGTRVSSVISRVTGATEPARLDAVVAPGTPRR